MALALVVEDNRQVSESMCLMLMMLGHQTKAAYNPRTAFKFLDESLPDIIFLDINLPNVDGFEILAFLRREPRTADTPVVIVTSNDQPETYRKASEGGALAVIIKPASVEALRGALSLAKIT